MSRLRDQSGLTVIELAVAAAISLVVLSIAMTMMITMWRGGTLTERHADATQQARQTSDRLARQLRNLASPGIEIAASTSAQPKAVDRNGPFDLVFKDVDEGPLTSPTLNPANVRRVRYCLQTTGAVPGGIGNASSARGVMWMQTQRNVANQALPAATPPDPACPGAGWDDQRIVADSITNANATPARPLFRYSSSTGEVTGTDDASREQIIRIATDLYIDPDTTRKPEEAHLVTSVVLRNQNRVPTANFSIIAVGSCTVQLNGSGSDDPENKRLNYQWWMDGALLSADLQNRVVVQKAVSSGPHTFKLVVIDPAELQSAPTTQSFTAC